MVLQQEIKKVQNRTARFVTCNYSFETGSMTGMLENLKWESLKKKRRDYRLILLYKGIKGCQHSYSHFDLGVHVPLGFSIWGYRSLFEGTHILG